MGAPDKIGSDDEHPLHPVQVDPFWMGKFEVTQEQYEAVMGNNPSHFKGLRRPVESVSWRDAAEFCRRFSMRHGVSARLPSEAEWEYAARGGSGSMHFWEEGREGSYAWYNANSGEGTHPVGLKMPNPWGLHDTAGNVWEWCMDWYDRNYYSTSPSANPRGPLLGNFRVLRGGSWDLPVYFLRLPHRERNSPSNWNNVLGFRVLVEGMMK